MDPQACWDEIMELLRDFRKSRDDCARDGLREELVVHLESLAHWVDHGGFLPQAKE